MAEYILRDQAIMAVTGAKLPDVSASGLPIANGKRSVTDCVRRLKEISAADVRPVPEGGIGEMSDGYHTFNGLYYQRMMQALKDMEHEVRLRFGFAERDNIVVPPFSMLAAEEGE